MATMMFFLCRFSVFLFWIYFLYPGFANDDFEGQMSVVVQHALDPEPDAKFTNRGIVLIKSIRNGVASYSADDGWTNEEKRKLKALVDSDDIYRLRIVTKNDDPPQYVSTFIKACSLYESRLSDKISLHLDQSGEILGVSLTTENMLCGGSKGINIDSQIYGFNTTVEIRQMENGPVPDTASYLQKMEKEKLEKAKGEQSDNRSFFAKYWMYIVPVFIFLLISGAGNPDAQSGGGGR